MSFLNHRCTRLSHVSIRTLCSLDQCPFAQVSSEERQMAGAPQGQIFDVVALKSSEVPASVDVSKDLEVRTKE